jgi:hypothetical protein
MRRGAGVRLGKLSGEEGGVKDKIKPVAYRQYSERDYTQHGCDGEYKLWELFPGTEPPNGAQPLYDQSAIDALCAEVEALRGGMTPRGDDMIVPMTLLDEINAVGAGYMADAMRYRWLRDGSNTEAVATIGAYGGDELDAAIDAAMKDDAP